VDVEVDGRRCAHKAIMATAADATAGLAAGCEETKPAA
jgi:hypothetical protein